MTGATLMRLLCDIQRLMSACRFSCAQDAFARSACSRKPLHEVSLAAGTRQEEVLIWDLHMRIKSVRLTKWGGDSSWTGWPRLTLEYEGCRILTDNMFFWQANTLRLKLTPPISAASMNSPNPSRITVLDAPPWKPNAEGLASSPL